MSSSSYRARRQFPVGRGWRHVAVVDAGCGCRPRRATSRLLSQLPSFLRPSPGTKPTSSSSSAPVGRSSSRSSSGFFPSSASTASSATFTTTHSSFSSKHHDDESYDKRTTTKPARAAATPPAPRRRQPHPGGRARKKRYEKVEEGSSSGSNGTGVGVAVEKESCDPRADFRESMVQMVMETGLCGWDDLRCMLRRLLALNAPRHHAAILAAFAEVCAQLTAPPPTLPAYGHYHHQQPYDDYHYHY